MHIDAIVSLLPSDPLLGIELGHPLPQRVGPARLCLDAHLHCLHGGESNVGKEFSTSAGSQVEGRSISVGIFLNKQRETTRKLYIAGSQLRRHTNMSLTSPSKLE